jgi:DNA-binding PadR family transcriptional regulator
MVARRTRKKPLLSGKSPVPAALLAAVIEKPGHGWDVASRASRRIGSSWPFDRKNIYTYLDRLEEQGLIRSQREPAGQKDEPRDVYYPTEKGEEARREWLTMPLRQDGAPSDLDVRLLFSTKEDIPDLLDCFDERHEQILEEIEMAEAGETPNVSYLALVINAQRSAVGRRLRAELEWLQDTRRQLELERDRPSL